MRKEEEKPISVYIPPNFEAGLNLFGISDNIETLIEGGVLVALPYIIIFGLGLLKGISLTNRIGIASCFALVLGYLGFVGIGGDKIGRYISKIIVFNLNKRVAYYNPRIKKEVIGSNSGFSKDELPKEKLMRLYKEIKVRFQKRNVPIKEMHKEIHTGLFIFEDDIEATDKRKDDKWILSEKIKKVMKK